MPLLLDDHVDAILGAQATKEVTIPILTGDFRKEVERKGIEVPTVTLEYTPTAIDGYAEDAFASGRNFEGAMRLIEAVVVTWDLQIRGRDGEPEVVPLDREGLDRLHDRMPQAVMGIALNLLENFGERGKGSSTGSRKRLSIRKAR